jgi:hypothetical protein
MLKFKSLPLFATLAVAALTAGAASSKADIIFGNFATPPQAPAHPLPPPTTPTRLWPIIRRPSYPMA